MLGRDGGQGAKKYDSRKTRARLGLSIASVVNSQLSAAGARDFSLPGEKADVGANVRVGVAIRREEREKIAGAREEVLSQDRFIYIPRY